MGILNPDKTDFDTEDLTFRPKLLSEFIGQKRVKDQLEIFLQSARMRKSVLEHVLLSGPPGLGKTTVANILANEIGKNFVNITGPSLKKAEDIISILISLNRGDVLFIDEIHGMSRIIEEILYPAMEDFKLPFTRTVGDKKEILNVKLKPFTLVGATTKDGSLTAPFRDRFGIHLEFDMYNKEDLVEVIRRTCSLLNIPITHEGVDAIAARSRGTPRIANRLIRRVRDVMVVRGSIEINKKIATIAFAMLEIDDLGLEDLDRKIIYHIHKYYKNGPVGVKAIAMNVGKDIRTIEDVYEPFLNHIGFLIRTPKGREVTPMALEHLQNLDNKFGVKYDVHIRKKEKKDKNDTIQDDQKTDMGNVRNDNIRNIALIDEEDMK